MPSQNNEESILLAHFGDKADGRVLDVGAWNAEVLSNSHALIARGWGGVLVEPSPKPFAGLLDAYGERSDVELVNVAVADKSGLATFYDSGGDALSTLSPEHRDKWARDTKFKSFTVSTVTVGELLSHTGTDFEVLSIDVEGSSASLLPSFGIGEWPKLKAVIVEHDGFADLLKNYVAKFGFAEATRNGENGVYLR